MAIRKYTVSYRNERRTRRDISVPFLPLSGKWLEQLGFDIDTPIAVECSDGRLVITRRSADVQ